MTNAPYEARLEAVKAANFGHVLLRAARRLNERAVVRARHVLGNGVRVAHTQLFPHVDLEGTRLTELARRVGLTKQAVGQLVGDLEDAGVLERVPDPTDGRARLVRVTDEGRQALLVGLDMLATVADEVRPRVGEARMARLFRDLSVLLDALEALAAEEAGDDP